MSALVGDRRLRATRARRASAAARRDGADIKARTTAWQAGALVGPAAAEMVEGGGG
ncbi:hypothetical protein Sme01_47620 [Sphaerisporangium melleum]|uniref:Uncharacterized protein n=1 Tax=Sphaerisporangium melleum TaxID=321316 RepID=A0A917VU84_9ACTN|nr:hypothetical protein [Sphaerisporangium melleum]GGL18998.1 hypothetical protein GCM10007964_71250 [Sphaerisporangium melleum]GII72286.1 hypothetical protein Sme01_47620 [Sphaerisporangium melleum]